MVDFGEFEGGFVDGRAVVVGAGGEVVEDGTFVAGGPGVPEELHGLAGDDGDVGFAWGAGFVADYVGGLVAVGGDLWLALVGWLIRLREDRWIDGLMEGRFGEDLRNRSQGLWCSILRLGEGWVGSSS